MPKLQEGIKNLKGIRVRTGTDKRIRKDFNFKEKRRSPRRVDVQEKIVGFFPNRLVKSRIT